MTILSAQIELFNHFAKKDSFSFKDDFESLAITSKNDKLDKLTVLAALEELEKAQLLLKKGAYWISIKPFIQLEQKITLTWNTISLIIEILNEVTKNKKEHAVLLPNPLNITEKDIYNALLVLCK